MADTVTAYPLAWPAAKPRTQKRVQTPFYKTDRDLGYATLRLTVAEACSRLATELRRLKAWDAGDVVVSTNLKIGRDGWPRADQKAPADPGVAVYFKLDGDPIVLACDRYYSVAGNIAAIAKHIEASRAIERYGVGTLREVFRGFTALPAASSVNDWRRELKEPRDLAEAEQNYRDLIRRAHPDIAGPQSTARAAALSAAIDLARKYYGAAR